MDTTLYNHVDSILAELAARNEEIKASLNAGGDPTLSKLLVDFLQLQAIKEDAEREQVAIIQRVNDALQKIYGNVYHSVPLEEKLTNARAYIADLLAGQEVV